MTLSSLKNMILKAIDSYSENLIDCQRHLHQFPELSNSEFKTTSFIAERLKEFGYDVHIRPEGVGLFADLVAPSSSEKRKMVAIRADIDALPIQESTGLPYSSKVDGVMHACGHDIHTTSVLGVAYAFSMIREQLDFPVRLIFQHAEEITAHGAFELVDFGALDGVDAILSLHADPSRRLGTIGVREGNFTASYDAFTITVHGKAGHGARPHESIDTVYVLTKVASALYELIGRYFDSRDPAVLSIGMIQAGVASNAIPASGKLAGTIRTLSWKHRELVQPLLTRTAEGVCATFGANCEIFFEVGSPPVQNDKVCTGWVREAGIELLGAQNVDEIDLPSMGSEDFAHYLKDRPGCMFRLGVIGEGGDFSHLHSNHMIADSRAAIVGAKVLSCALLNAQFS